MPEEQTLPYICHVFVCTNDRQGARKSCADGNSLAIQSLLKEEVKNRGWAGRVRVSSSGCMGLCEKGPNVAIYPQKIWFPSATTSAVPEILTKIASQLSAQSVT